MLTSVGALAVVLATAIPAPAPSPSPSPSTSGRAGQQSKSPVISGTISEIQCQSAECDLGAGSVPAVTTVAPVAASGSGQPPRLACQFTPDPGFIPPATMSPADAHAGEAGSWVLRRCPRNDVDVMGRAPLPTVGKIVWVPAVAPMTPSALAQVAYKKLKPPDADAGLESAEYATGVGRDAAMALGPRLIVGPGDRERVGGRGVGDRDRNAGVGDVVNGRRRERDMPRAGDAVSV